MGAVSGRLGNFGGAARCRQGRIQPNPPYKSTKAVRSNIRDLNPENVHSIAPYAQIPAQYAENRAQPLDTYQT